MDTKKHLQVVLTIITRGEDACSRKCPFMTVGSPDFYCILFDKELVVDPTASYDEKSQRFGELRVYRSEDCVSSKCVDIPDKGV